MVCFGSFARAWVVCGCVMCFAYSRGLVYCCGLYGRYCGTEFGLVVFWLCCFTLVL